MANSHSDSNMKEISIVVIIVLAIFVGGFALGKGTTAMDQKPDTSQLAGARFVLKPYTGVGSGVYKHGTIVKVVNGTPQVVGHFDDETGELSAGTVELVEVK